MTFVYIHGYGSTGQAFKAQLLRQMFPSCRLESPTIDYNRLSPYEVYRQLQAIVGNEHPDLILGSSTGGYYALCCTRFFAGPVWCVNPVRDIQATIQQLLPQASPIGENPSPVADAKNSNQTLFQQRLEEYGAFDREIFQQLAPRKGQLHFALSTDDELLGDHGPLLGLFPNYGSVVWKEDCGHRFLRFEELKDAITESLVSHASCR